MCVRYTLKTEPRMIAQHFGLTEFPEYPRRYNIGPTQNGLVLRAATTPASREAAWLRWGLIPAWSKAGGDWPALFNARAETVADKPAFRDAFRRRRCLVVADGYYFWTQSTVRQPYHVTLNRGAVFAMAGLWERWEPPGASGQGVVETFTVITTTPNELIAPMHPRMPAILDPDFYEDWINPLVTDADALQPLLKPWPGVQMLTRAVSAYVNDIKHDDAACLARPTGVSASVAQKPVRPGAQLDLGLEADRDPSDS